ncbi:caspase-8 isoform X2 [Magallana gigas]|uniref:caspase-8 isoform X2 n=1 Tax=Magallana gigas TaxID=29159 RepID=UPI0033406C3A
MEATTSNCRMLLIEINEKLSSDDFQSLTFLAKDIVNRKRIKEKENRLEFFEDLEKKAVIKCGTEETDLLFLKQAFLIMGKNNLVSALDEVGEGPCKQSSRETFVNTRRKLLYKVGEETGKDELKNLKAYLSSKVGVGKRTLDLIRDVWDCLDVLEERLSDSEMFPLLKTLYAADENLPGLLEDFIKGINCIAIVRATGGQTDKAPVQEVGEHDEAQTHTQLGTQVEDRAGSEEATYDPPPSGGSTMTPDGAPSGFSATTLPSRLGAYDKGKNAGICIILNNEIFANANTHPTRNGTNADRDLLEYSFKLFGFDVRVYNNNTCQEITQLLGEIQQIDHKDNGALVVCTLSHGNLNVVSGACGQDLPINFMTSLFRADNCPSLAGKPKFFIFQACQGKDTQDVWHQTNAPVMAESDTNLVPNMAEVMTEVPHLHQLNLAPAEADFLIAHSTMPGYVSFRNGKGSFFVQSLVKHLKAHSPREDVISILVEVNRDVSQTIGRTSGGQIAAQIPEPKVRLTKKFYLFPVETEV